MPSKQQTDTQVLEVKASTMNRGMLALTTGVSYKTHSCPLSKQPHTVAQLSRFPTFGHHIISKSCRRWSPDHMGYLHIENGPLRKIGSCNVCAFTKTAAQGSNVWRQESLAGTCFCFRSQRFSPKKDQV